MSSHSATPLGVHLNGSLPFQSTDETLEFIGNQLTPWVKRVPDGETGERRGWVLTQSRHFFEHPAFTRVEPTDEIRRPLVRLKPGVDLDKLTFEPFSYDEFARESYPRFRAAKGRGELPADARFLVSLPTPFNAVSFFVVLKDQPKVVRAYDAQAKRALDGILQVVPAHELAIQWDLPTELATFEGWFRNPFPDEAAILESVARVSAWVPSSVELGYHLCYGDTKFGASPFMGTPPSEECPVRKDIGRNIVPQDASTLVRLINALGESIVRPINFIQVATMREWDTAAHWQPLSNLRLRPETELYVGLVHASDGVEGARVRQEFVAKHVKRFGVSTECGLGRHSHEQLQQVVTTFNGLLSRVNEGSKAAE